MLTSLLPAGCYDLLPPEARQESALSQALLSVFESFGYEQASPPLLEYSDNLLAGRGAALSGQMFRVMDPGAHRVMGVRADITLQIARIAATRLAAAPRPLRLCYNGLILRMQGERLKPERQLRQAGIELIGAASPEADAEVILVAAEALKRVGIGKLSIDLNLPGIVGSLLAEEALDNDAAQSLLAAVAHKDIAAIGRAPIRTREALIGLIRCAGDAQRALFAMEALDLPGDARRQFAELREVVAILSASGNPDWTLTVDATENRGLAYHSGIAFSIFVPGAAHEAGRGGRYRIDNAAGGEEATGFTLYVESLRTLLPPAAPQKRVFIPGGIADRTAAELREQGYVTVHALAEYGDGEEEARRLGCGFIFRDGKIVVIPA